MNKQRLGPTVSTLDALRERRKSLESELETVTCQIAFVEASIQGERDRMKTACARTICDDCHNGALLEIDGCKAFHFNGLGVKVPCKASEIWVSANLILEDMLEHDYE